MCIKENKTFHRKAFSATLQASTDPFDTCVSDYCYSYLIRRKYSYFSLKKYSLMIAPQEMCIGTILICKLKVT